MSDAQVREVVAILKSMGLEVRAISKDTPLKDIAKLARKKKEKHGPL